MKNSLQNEKYFHDDSIMSHEIAPNSADARQIIHYDELMTNIEWRLNSL